MCFWELFRRGEGVRICAARRPILAEVGDARVLPRAVAVAETVWALHALRAPEAPGELRGTGASTFHAEALRHFGVWEVFLFIEAHLARDDAPLAPSAQLSGNHAVRGARAGPKPCYGAPDTGNESRFELSCTYVGFYSDFRVRHHLVWVFGVRRTEGSLARCELTLCPHATPDPAPRVCACSALLAPAPPAEEVAPRGGLCILGESWPDRPMPDPASLTWTEVLQQPCALGFTIPVYVSGVSGRLRTFQIAVRVFSGIFGRCGSLQGSFPALWNTLGSVTSPA